jgi:hypothetical protein
MPGQTSRGAPDATNRSKFEQDIRAAYVLKIRIERAQEMLIYCHKLTEAVDRNDLQSVQKLLRDIPGTLEFLDGGYDIYGVCLFPTDADRVKGRLKDFERSLRRAQEISTTDPQALKVCVSKLSTNATGIRDVLQKGLLAKLGEASEMTELVPLWCRATKIHAFSIKLRDYVTVASGTPDINFWSSVKNQYSDLTGIGEISISDLRQCGSVGLQLSAKLETPIENLYRSLNSVGSYIDIVGENAEKKRAENIGEFREYVRDVATYAHEIERELARTVEKHMFSLPVR